MHQTNQRSGDHSCRYWLRYAVLGMAEVPIYALRQRRWRLLAACLAAQLPYLAIIVWLYR